jgi:hypothetical protein
MCVCEYLDFIVMLRHFWVTYRSHTEGGISVECSCLASGVLPSDWNLRNKKENFQGARFTTQLRSRNCAFMHAVVWKSKKKNIIFLVLPAYVVDLCMT